MKAFRCAYCLFYNEARKTKLSVPKLTNLSNQSGNGRLEENGSKPRRRSKPNETKSGGSESLHSSLSSSASLDDLATMSEPILASSETSAAPHKQTDRRISVDKGNENEEKKNI